MSTLARLFQSIGRTGPARARHQALRELYRKFLDESGSAARGLRLLRDWLSPQQRAQFDRTGYFEVVGSHTGKRYRVHYGATTNVHEIDEIGRPKVGWCFVPEGYLVPGDVMLAQKIALETDELRVLKLANEFPVRSPRRVRFW
jgi:hypothetical protein